MAFALTADWSDADIATLIEIAAECGCQTTWLLNVMWLESGASATALNKSSGATGIIQFMPPNYRRWGYTQEQFAAIGVTKQLSYARGWFTAHRGKILTLVDAYLCVFLPAEVGSGSDDDHVQCIDAERFAAGAWVRAEQRYASFARANPALCDRIVRTDSARLENYHAWRISTRSIDRALEKARINAEIGSARYRELLARILSTEASRMLQAQTEATVGLDPGIVGVQRALSRLAVAHGMPTWHPGAADGDAGPRTEAAVKAYQRAHGLVADGNAGPLTRAALLDDIQRLGKPA